MIPRHDGRAKRRIGAAHGSARSRQRRKGRGARLLSYLIVGQIFGPRRGSRRSCRQPGGGGHEKTEDQPHALALAYEKNNVRAARGRWAPQLMEISPKRCGRFRHGRRRPRRSRRSLFPSRSPQRDPRPLVGLRVRIRLPPAASLQTVSPSRDPGSLQSTLLPQASS